MAAEYTIEIYQINVLEGTYTRLSEIITFENLEFFQGINQVGAASFQIHVLDSKCDLNILRPDRVVLIKRNNEAVWLGRIEHPIEGEFSSIDGVDGYLSIKCLEYISFLKDRYTDNDTQYSDLDASVIATNLIDLTQNRTNGNLNIVTGSIETVGTTNDTLEYQGILDAMQNQSDNIVGYEFYINPLVDDNNLLESAQFNLVKARGSQRDDLPPLQLGENVQSLSFSTRTPVYNTTTFLGNGTGEAVITAIAEDEGSQLGYTRKERILKVGDYKIQANIDAAALESNNQTKITHYAINVTLNPASRLDFGTLQLGDVVFIDLFIEGTTIGFSGSARIIELNVSVDEVGAEFITPKLEYYA